ncbi:MAG: BamA/TamA family outer membrane protein, partial [Ignavibacteria bacterium]|nr:BamA/TamA family outer membrane protein [Ignavibacteria bacterium]
RRDKDTGEKKGNPLFYKIFENDITIDIRIHMNVGDDKAYVYGQSSESPVVRIIGGKGKDEFVDESSVQGYFLSFTPFPVVEQRTNFYDSGKNTIVVEGPGTNFDDAKWPYPKDDLEKYEPQQIDRGHNWLPVPIIGLDTDYGLTIGGGVKLLKYNFRAIPMEYSQQLTVSYATSFGNFAIEYEGDFYSLVRWGRLNLLIAETQQFVTRYFGYGNETSYNKNLEQSNYYEVNQRLTTIYPTMFYSFKKNIVGSLGVSFVRTNTSLQNDTLLTGFRYGDYGLGKIDPFGINLGLTIDGRDHPDFPTNGYWLNFVGRIFPEIFKVEEAFYYSEIDLRGYVTPEFSSIITLAFRAGGSKVFGKYPFFGGATVGGSRNLRGYNDKRFSGDAAVFGQTELRIFITKLNLLFKNRLGINLFAETGRVFTEGIKSDKWHPSYGFGIWIAYLNSTIIGSTYVAFSPERTTFSLGIGMGF